MTDVVVPNVGESISSGILTSWLKQEGELVQEGDNLFELETDKATLEIPAPTAGVLHIQAELGKGGSHRLGGGQHRRKRHHRSTTCHHRITITR